VIDILKSQWLILSEAARSFRKNNDRTSASSLAFYSTISLIPALVLLTYLMGFTLGSSQTVLNKTRILMWEFLPAYNMGILDELMHIAGSRKAIGVINLLILFWSMTPLMSSIRVSFASIYKIPLKKTFLLHKIIDLAIISMILTGLSAIAAGGVLLNILHLDFIPQYLVIFVPFLIAMTLLFITYLAFSPLMHPAYILAGAFVSTFIWFTMRPMFNLFLTYNTGFGFTLGSFKSLFVAVIWIYLSQCIFLYGAEIVACLRRKETVVIRRLIDGKKRIPIRKANALTVEIEKGTMIFDEGEKGDEMFYILSGTVDIVKDGRNITSIESGKYFGEMSFLISASRTASAVAREDVRLIRISHRNFGIMMKEFPELVPELLKEMASRLKETTGMVV
jgi:YihY family inner membrane protein